MTGNVEYKCNNCGHEGLNTRAVPDVPELVRYGKVDGVLMMKSDGEYVLYSQAAEIIAAKDKEIGRAEKHRNDMADKIVDQRTEMAALKAKLAQYEAQRPVVWVDENGMASFTLGGISTVHARFETCKSERFCFPLYASPAPAADLKAENDKLRKAAQKVIERWDTPAWKDVAPTADAINDLRTALNPSEPQND